MHRVAGAAFGAALTWIGAAAAQTAAPAGGGLYQVIPAQPSPRQTLMVQELNYLMRIWPGEYDNREQVQFDSDVGKKSLEAGGHARIHSSVRRVSLPAFGEHVLYVEEYRDNDPARLFRQRLYVLAADEQAKAIRLTLHFFKDGKKHLGAHLDPGKLAGVTPADTTTLPGCDILIRRDVDGLLGGMNPATCVFGDDGKKRAGDYQVRVTEDGVWFRDRTLDPATGKVIEQWADFSWHQLERARLFACMIDFPKEPGSPVQYTDKYIVVHDQGGTYPFVHPDGRPMVMTLRNNWSYGMQRETLVVVVQDKDERGKTLAYGWTEPGADRIGINPEWMRVQCDLDTELNRKLQQDLRPES
ncbi:MAG: chromophore lyase CpcT/CpeT [Rhodospirillaceae bacterium]|nr:chromophore lyase CpcT/CpeT [Rhodospirillaceae bacterium]